MCREQACTRLCGVRYDLVVRLDSSRGVCPVDAIGAELCRRLVKYRLRLLAMEYKTALRAGEQNGCGQRAANQSQKKLVKVYLGDSSPPTLSIAAIPIV